MAKKMGTNPLVGLNGLIRNTQDEPHNVHGAHDVYEAQSIHVAQEAHDPHDVHTAPYAPGAPRTQGRKGQKLPRINMAFSPENLAYLQAIAGFERMSATQYVNNLIKQDMQDRHTLYEQLLALRG